MNIILLSGGSGKRLWPLSNDTRSKQFLKLLKNEDNQYESMLQRVYRQIKQVDSNSNIIVATVASQIDSIKNQLKEQAEIVLEPERRDTFPAIALACSYLYLEKGLSVDEAVLVIPVDPYADIEYFETLIKMEQAVLQNQADMVLMGIKPTYPSAKYGYMTPNMDKGRIFQNANIYPVESFTEKPSEEKASVIIKDGAVWNCGVFAFKLRYMKDIIKDRYGVFSSYQEIYRNYSKLKKISFDYEVVEKADSVAMIPYEGYWKDLGTWNTLTEEMKEPNIGTVIIGEGTNNTNVINELSIPVVALGMEDVVIAASPDGILVSNKHKSSYLKPYVEGLDNRPMYEERRWGDYKVLDYCKYSDDMKSLTKHMTILKGNGVSYQSHKYRDEIWTIVDGTGDLLIEGHIRNVRRGDVAYITKGQKHALRATTDLHFIEVQIGEELIEEDIEKFEWDWESK